MSDRRFGFESLQTRYRILALACIVLFGIVLGQLAYLQLVRGESYEKRAEDNRIRPEIIRANRGRLLDRRGRVLADNAPTYHLSIDARDRAFRKDPAVRDRVIHELAVILDRDEEALGREIEQARRKRLPPIPLARNLDFAALSVLLERPDHLSGVEVSPQPARRYPHGTLAAHLIGYLGEVSEEETETAASAHPYRPGDLTGRSGVERRYEAGLRGVDGVDYVEVDALGRRTQLFGDIPFEPSQAGSDIILTLDLDVQRAAEAALDSISNETEGGTRIPARGAIVALDPRSGEVIAMASRPTFDPNLFVGKLSREDWRTLSGSGHPLLNRATQSSYPPGSTFKILTGLAGLSEQALTPTTVMPSPCHGGLFFGNRFFRCHRREGHGRPMLREAIARSCDTYFYQVGIRLGVDRLMRYAGACSLGVPTRIDLPQERQPLVPMLDWYIKNRGGAPGPGVALNLAIGQGELLLTPIGLARFIAAVVNGGTILQPRVVREIVNAEGEAIQDRRDRMEGAGRLPATAEHLRVIRDCMEAVVMDPMGTGRRAQVAGFRVGGKTGTAQNPHGEDHALFVGYAPAEDAEIVVVVVLEESGHGGAVAAPAAQRVLEAYLNPPGLPVAGVE